MECVPRQLGVYRLFVRTVWSYLLLVHPWVDLPRDHGHMFTTCVTILGMCCTTLPGCKCAMLQFVKLFLHADSIAGCRFMWYIDIL